MKDFSKYPLKSVKMEWPKAWNTKLSSLTAAGSYVSNTASLPSSSAAKKELKEMLSLRKENFMNVVLRSLSVLLMLSNSERITDFSSI